MRNIILLLVLLMPFCWHCGGSLPEMHYYLIDYPVTSQSDRVEVVRPVVIGVARLDAAPLYREERLVYRDSPYEGKYYHYHRWIASPGQMIADKLIEHLRASNRFAQVVAFPKYSRVDFVLQGIINALEEWDEDGQWYARVQLSFELMDSKTSELVWQKTLVQKNRVTEKQPAAVVAGINLGVQQCIETLEQELAAYFLK
ncbi:MAG: ABC-type transport auxiliary lipoprotein family protein [candidate division KSB1 bacterium]|nr:ABC-type transport auxiliary lipoprotein family protein [candidate division KSB1 bacterium]MDZ7317969.1 ABC-type transport auxiliary lipoprotein family protein [candidate division KSB1 bacterium]MDZ7341874.1 ABC-type transport auxiliary lipoprotein family protein [candidate division KSB1 bacterium]